MSSTFDPPKAVPYCSLQAPTFSDCDILIDRPETYVPLTTPAFPDNNSIILPTVLAKGEGCSAP